MQVIEISKGGKVKYELDKKTGLIKVKNHKFFIENMHNGSWLGTEM